MKNATPVILALTLLAPACGGGDEGDAPAPATGGAAGGGAAGEDEGGGEAGSDGEGGSATGGSNEGGGGNAGGAAGAAASSGGGTPVPEGGPGIAEHICAAPAPAVPVDDISGRWAYLEVQTQIVQAPAMADPFQNVVVTAVLLEQSQNGDSVTGTGTVCHRHTDGSVVAVAIPDRVIESIEPFSYTATYGADGSYVMDPVYMLLGYVPEDPTDVSELPTTADDERVYDQDGDGNPGVTMVLSGLMDGLVYAVQWNRIVPAGVTVAEDRIEGLLEFDLDENVIGSDPELIARLATEAFPDPEPCWSTFQMVRVPDEADCDWLRAELVTLFPEVEPTLPE